MRLSFQLMLQSDDSLSHLHISPLSIVRIQINFIDQSSDSIGKVRVDIPQKQFYLGKSLISALRFG